MIVLSDTNIHPAPIRGTSNIEDCADACSLHPECKAYVFLSNGHCYFKSSNEIPLVDASISKSGSLNNCIYTKNAKDVQTINPLWPNCIVEGKTYAGKYNNLIL